MAVISYDIITEDLPDAKEDITITSGDWNILASDQQHIQHIIKSNKGQWYQHPLIGFGVMNYLNASINATRIIQGIKLQLKSDNYKPLQVTVNDALELTINAERII